MKKKEAQQNQPFKFSFTDKYFRKKLQVGTYENYVTYHAKYIDERMTVTIRTHDTGPLLSRVLTPKATGQLAKDINNYVQEFKKKSRKKDFYKEFWEHATFEEILSSLRKYNEKKHYLDDINPKSLTSPAGMIKLKKQLLQNVRDDPGMLRRSDNSEALTLFIHIIHDARWNLDKNIAETAKNLLSRHLIPNRQKKPLPSSQALRMARELMVYLAKYLSKKCENEIDGCVEATWQADYKHLSKWASNNEKRIYGYSREDLKKLILQPASYVNDIITDHYQISLSTLKRRLK